MYVLLTTQDCKYCDKAKALLRQHGKYYTEFDISELPVIREFFVSNEFKTVPQIFENGFHVGGYTELTSYIKDIH